CSQGSLSLLQGYDYATPQGHSYLSAYLLQQFGANRWTCTLSENTLTFGYKPSRDETTLSFAVTKTTLTLLRMSTLEAQVQFQGPVLIDWGGDDLNSPSDVFKVSSSTITNKSLIPSNFHFYAKDFQNQGTYQGNEGFLSVDAFNNAGQTLCIPKLKLQTALFNNEGGHLLGESSLDVFVSGSFRNKGGEIGSEGRTRLDLSLNAATVENLGTIRGSHTFIVSQNPLNLQRGVIEGHKKVYFHTPFLKGSELDIATPLCMMKTQDFHLPPQKHCERLVFILKPKQDFTSDYPFTSEGSFEIWERGLESREHAEHIMDARFPEEGPVPAFEQTIHLKRPLNVGLLRIFMPRAKVRVGDENGALLDYLMEKGNVDILASVFDLEKGTFVGLNSHIHAPGGITLGRLVVDPMREVFTTFGWHGQNSWSHHLGEHLVNVTYEFFGQRLQNVYDGYCLARFPVVHGNGSSFLTRHTSTLKGPLVQHATFETNDLNLSSKEHLLEASKTTVHNNLTFQKTKTIILQPVTGIMRYGFWDHNFQACTPLSSTFLNSDGATLRVEGNIHSETPLTLINKASILHAGRKSPAITIQDEAFTLKGVTFFQKIYGGTKAERDELTTRVSGINLQRWFTCPFGVRGYDGDQKAASFLSKTNNFEGAQNTFLPHTTFTDGVVFGAHQPIPTNLSAPLSIAFVGKEGRIIGISNPHYVPPQSPLGNLMEDAISMGTVKLNVHLEGGLPPLFKFQERFWHDSVKAQAFYDKIRPHVVTLSRMGIYIPQENPLLTLSPKLLLERIQANVQKKLGRGYIDHGKPLDEELLIELHENATEYLRSLPESLYKEALTALVRRGETSPVSLPQKPLIFYTEVTDEHGVISFSPDVYYPEHLLTFMGKSRGAVMHVGTFLALPEGMTFEQAQQRFTGIRVPQALLSHVAQENPHLMGFFERLALEGPSDSQTQDLTEFAQGPLTVHGDIEADNLMLMPAGKLTLAGDVRIQSTHALLASLFDDLDANALIKRIVHQHGFDDVLLGRVQINARGILNLFAGNDIKMEAIETRSQLGTYIQALGDLFDVPATLLHERVESHRHKKKSTTTITHASQAVRSEHSSIGPVVTSAVGANVQQGNIITAQHIVTQGAVIRELPALSGVQQSTTSSKKGSFGSKSSSQSSSSTVIAEPCVRNARETVPYLGEALSITGTEIHAGGQVSFLTPGGRGEVRLLTRRDTSQSSSSSSSSSVLWGLQKQSGDTVSIPRGVIIDSPLPVIVYAASLVLEETPGVPSLRDKIETQAHIQSLLAQIESHSSHTSHSGPSPVVAGLVALTIAIATEGWGAGLAEGLMASQAVG
ncbi:MAG TPA: hypothetical protein PLY23_08635, partial [Alphaproteobacteria bacterium]|nr:hypothetical protein [Alphaproteobacteria bacterium]